MKLLKLGLSRLHMAADSPLRFALAAVLLLTLSIALVAPVLADEAPPVFLAKWGTPGTGAGEFNHPHGEAIDLATGVLYVADKDNHRVQKFDGSEWTGFVGTAGSSGTGNYEFNQPYDVAVDSHGNVYVVDCYNYRVQEFDSGGSYVRTLGSQGGGDGEFSGPTGVAVDSFDNVYVCDYTTSRVEKFGSDGEWDLSWGSGGTETGQFTGLWGIAVDLATDNVYVADSGNDRVQEFTSTGTFIRTWGQHGDGDSEFWYPIGIAVDSAGAVYVADSSNSRIQKFDSEGNFLTKWGTLGTEDGEMQIPIGVTVNSSGLIYVADTQNNRIEAFGPAGRLDLPLKTGWNMVSVPLELADASPGAVFKGEIVAIYTWDPVAKSYTVPTTIEPECGYWVAVTEDKTITVTGTPVTEWDSDLTTGWNMVGSVHGDLRASRHHHHGPRPGPTRTQCRLLVGPHRKELHLHRTDRQGQGPLGGGHGRLLSDDVRP